MKRAEVPVGKHKYYHLALPSDFLVEVGDFNVGVGRIGDAVFDVVGIKRLLQLLNAIGDVGVLGVFVAVWRERDVHRVALVDACGRFHNKLRLILKSVVLNQLFDVGIGDAFLFGFVVDGQ